MGEVSHKVTSGKGYATLAPELTLWYKVKTVLSLLKRPSAFLPLAMSLFVLGLIVARIARFGTAREAGEGVEAHLFQLLMPLQLPIIAFFAATSQPHRSRAAFWVLLIQLIAALTDVGVVLFLRL